MPIRGWRALRADAALLAVAAIWGFTFVMVKLAVAALPPFNFLALRFWLAFAVLLTIFPRRTLAALPRALGPGFLIGAFLFGGYTFQTYGLMLTSASKAGFITGLAVVLVPCISALLFRRWPAWPVMAGVVAATAGLALLTLEGTLLPGSGDLLVLVGACFYALHIVTVGRFAPRFDPLALATLQLGGVALLSTLAALATEGWRPVPPGVWPAIILTGVFASALAMAVQNWAQRDTTAAHTAIIFASEPVFAALGGYLLAGEVLAARGWVGGALVILGTAVAELPAGVPSARVALRQLRPDGG
ncbi:MAG: DMT family transporter [bacterium]|nr:DMT family transporter [bacterium]